MMGNWIDYTTDHGVALLVLHDPPVNAFTHEMVKDLDDCITDARFNEDVHVMVVTGYGEHFFSAGANVSMLREVDADFRYNFFCHCGEMLTRLEQTPKLVIAALNGHAAGGGLELALACDLRVARRGAGELGLPELNLGLIPGTGGAQRLARIVGKSRALQLILESSMIDFDTAASIGLVNYVWETESPEAFVQQTLEYAHQFTLPNKAVLAVGRLKRALQAASEMPLSQALVFERELLAQLLNTADVAEGMQAWVEKRPASFQGK